MRANDEDRTRFYVCERLLACETRDIQARAEGDLDHLNPIADLRTQSESNEQHFAVFLPDKINYMCTWFTEAMSPNLNMMRYTPRSDKKKLCVRKKVCEW
jgi:hypothetical protein